MEGGQCVERERGLCQEEFWYVLWGGRGSGVCCGKGGGSDVCCGEGGVLVCVVGREGVLMCVVGRE